MEWGKESVPNGEDTKHASMTPGFDSVNEKGQIRGYTSMHVKN